MIRVVLLADLGRFGEIGDVVSVKNGFARNHLIPSGKAKRATREAIAEMEARKDELLKQREERRKALEALQGRIDGMRLEIRVHASPDGKLYGSIGPSIVAENIVEALGDGTRIDKDQIRIASQTIKHVGEHGVSVALGKDLSASLTLNVSAGGQQTYVAPAARTAPGEASGEEERRPGGARGDRGQAAPAGADGAPRSAGKGVAAQ